MAEALKITGLREFVRAVRAADAEQAKMIRLTNNYVADMVIDAAKPGVPSLTGKAKGSLRAQSTATLARVRGGGNSAPHYPWLDFGGRREGRGGGVARRPYIADGRFIYASYYDLRDSGRIQETMSDVFVDIAKRVGLDVTSGRAA